MFSLVDYFVTFVVTEDCECFGFDLRHSAGNRSILNSFDFLSGLKQLRLFFCVSWLFRDYGVYQLILIYSQGSNCHQVLFVML